jgi:chaperone required for assembly of F1-ATPase
VFQFNNRISSDHLYKILVPRVEEHDANLNTFFNTVATSHDFSTQKEYYKDLADEIEKKGIKSLSDGRTIKTSSAQDVIGFGLGAFVGI